MATSNAAQTCGLGDRKSRLRTSYDADLLLVEATRWPTSAPYAESQASY